MVQCGVVLSGTKWTPKKLGRSLGLEVTSQLRAPLWFPASSWFTNIHYSSSRGFSALFWSPRAPSTCVVQARPLTHIIKWVHLILKISKEETVFVLFVCLFFPSDFLSFTLWSGLESPVQVGPPVGVSCWEFHFCGFWRKDNGDSSNRLTLLAQCSRSFVLWLRK